MDKDTRLVVYLRRYMLNFREYNRATIWFLLVVLTAVSFPWNVRLNSIGVALLSLHWLIDKDLLKKVRSLFDEIGLIGLLLWGFFFMHLLGLLWSPDPMGGLQSVEVKLSFLILPLIFSTENYLVATNTRRLMLYFTISCCLSFFYATAYSFAHFHQSGLAVILNRMNISEGIMHPGYYSNYFAFALVWCVFEWRENRHLNKQIQIWLPFIMLFMSVALLLLISKTAILFMACFSVYVLWLLAGFFSKKGYRGIAFVASLLFCLAIAVSIPTIKHRILETFSDTGTMDKQTGLHNSTGSRIIAWEHEWDLIKANWLKGYGTGESNLLLKRTLMEDGYTNLATANMHTHNQVFHTWLDVGIVGVLLLMFILYISGRIFYRRGNSLAWWLIPLITFNILTDDMLEVQAGTVFFIFFLTLFLYGKNKKKEKFIVI